MQQRLERLDTMASFLQEPAKEFIKAIYQDFGHTMFVIYAWRSMIEQHKLYQQGREFRRDEGIWVVVDDEQVVTRATPGKSPHNIITRDGAPAALAFDMVPMNANGSLRWNTPKVEWGKIYARAWDFGLDPLGDTIGAHLKYDLCHFEEPAWKYKLHGFQLVQPHADLTRLI